MTSFLDDFGSALAALFPEEERPELHFSSIGNCGRQQLYRIRGVYPTDPRPGWSIWAPQMGHMAQVLATLAAQQMGYTLERTLDIELVRNEDGSRSLLAVKENPDAKVEWHGVIGSVDGVISDRELETPCVWDVKMRTAISYAQMVQAVTSGPEAFLHDDPASALQMQGYMAALGLEATIIWTAPWDSSVIRLLKGMAERGQIKGWLGALFPSALEVTWTPLVLPAVEEQQTLLAKRAEALTLAKEAGLTVVREYNPVAHKFPCEYCAYQTLCTAEGDSGDITLESWK